MQFPEPGILTVTNAPINILRRMRSRKRERRKAVTQNHPDNNNNNELSKVGQGLE